MPSNVVSWRRLRSWDPRNAGGVRDVVRALQPASHPSRERPKRTGQARGGQGRRGRDPGGVGIRTGAERGTRNGSAGRQRPAPPVAASARTGAARPCGDRSVRRLPRGGPAAEQQHTDQGGQLLGGWNASRHPKVRLSLRHGRSVQDRNRPVRSAQRARPTCKTARKGQADLHNSARGPTPTCKTAHKGQAGRAQRARGKQD
jgi:hypothetical protein